MDANEPVELIPEQEEDRWYLEKYIEAIAGQSKLMDKLGYQLITLELALPGLLAAVLKLTEGDKAVVLINGWFVLTFVCWLLALAATLRAVLPRPYKVDTEIIIGSSEDSSGKISIKAFFDKSAIYKRNWLIVALVLFWLGIIFAVLLLFT